MNVLILFFHRLTKQYTLFQEQQLVVVIVVLVVADSLIRLIVYETQPFSILVE